MGRRVEEKVDRFRLGHALVGGELDRIDAKESFVLTGPDERFEARDDARAPGAGRFHRAEPIFQELLVDRSYDTTSFPAPFKLMIRFNMQVVSDSLEFFIFP